MIITFPSDTGSIIDKMRGAAGRDISINNYSEPTTCSACFLDPTTGLSSDPYCSVCSGLYYITTLDVTTVSGHIRWYPIDDPIYTPGGIVEDGDCVVTVAYSSGVQTKVDTAESFTVDTNRLLLQKYVLRGKPINRIRLILKEG